MPRLSVWPQVTVRFSWARHRLFDRLTTLLLYDLCVERDTATVVSVRQSPKPKWRPVPLSTVELQKLASQHLRLPQAGHSPP